MLVIWSCSVAANSVLPGVKQLIIILLLAPDATLVLNLCEFGSALFIHAILKVAAHGAVSLSDLAKDISLMRLLVKGFLEGSLLVCPVLAVNLIVDLRLVVLFVPFSLLLHGLLEKDVLLSILVHVLEEVDTSLVFSTPLLLTCVPLLLVLFLSKCLKMALLCCLVSLNVLVVALQFLDLVAAGQTLSSFEVFNSLLTLEGG